MIVVNGTVCNKCVGHVKTIRYQQDRINELILEQSVFMDGVNAIVDQDDADNVWFYYDEEDNFIENLNDEVSVVISAKALKRLLK